MNPKNDTPFSWLDNVHDEQDIKWAIKHLERKHSSFLSILLPEHYYELGSLFTYPHSKANLIGYTTFLKETLSKHTNSMGAPYWQIMEIDRLMKKAWNSHQKRKTSDKIQKTFFLSKSATSQLAKMAKAQRMKQESTLESLIEADNATIIKYRKEVSELKQSLAKNNDQIGELNDQLLDMYNALITAYENHTHQCAVLRDYINISHKTHEEIVSAEARSNELLTDAIKEYDSQVDELKKERDKRSSALREIRSLASEHAK